MRQEFAQHYPRPGWVEHDAENIWRDTVDTLRKAAAADGGKVAAVGIANQRETVVVWDRKTGDPVHNAIVWQDGITPRPRRARIGRLPDRRPDGRHGR